MYTKIHNITSQTTLRNGDICVWSADGYISFMRNGVVLRRGDGSTSFSVKRCSISQAYLLVKMIGELNNLTALISGSDFNGNFEFYFS